MLLCYASLLIFTKSSVDCFITYQVLDGAAVFQSISFRKCLWSWFMY